MATVDQFPDDEGLERTARALGIAPSDLLGHGGEAWVFSLGRDRVVRIHHAATTADDVERRGELLTELARTADRVPFAIPEVIDTGLVGERIVSVEHRLPGITVLDALSRGERSDHLIPAYLDAAAALGDLAVERPWFGDLSASDPVRTTTFAEWAEARAKRSLVDAGPDFAGIDASAVAAALPDPDSGSLVHLDAFAGNMLTDGQVITAVLDFGPTAAIADRRLDPVAAAVYLTLEITPTATDRHRAIARRWLNDRGLSSLVDPVTCWLAAYWSFATDDLRLHHWCRRVLLG